MKTEIPTAVRYFVLMILSYYMGSFLNFLSWPFYGQPGVWASLVEFCLLAAAGVLGFGSVFFLVMTLRSIVWK